jgi:uncharacterized protein YebE (UPF0316 family)
LEYGRWDVCKWRFKNIFFIHIALKQSELVVVGALHLFKRYRYIWTCCSFFSLCVYCANMFFFLWSLELLHGLLRGGLLI